MVLETEVYIHLFVRCRTGHSSTPWPILAASISTRNWPGYFTGGPDRSTGQWRLGNTGTRRQDPYAADGLRAKFINR